MQKNLRNTLQLCICILFISNAFSQEKKTLDHTAYADWKSVRNDKISDNGLYVSYEINPYLGDGWLFIKIRRQWKRILFQEGNLWRFRPTIQFAVFYMAPGYDTIRQCELKKVSKKKWPRRTA